MKPRGNCIFHNPAFPMRSKKWRINAAFRYLQETVNAFVEMVRTFGQDRFEFILNETQTHQIIQNVKKRFSDLGILYIGMGNET